MGDEEREKIDRAASEVRGWIEDAVGDMAHSYHDFLNEKWSRKIKAARKNGVVDLKGWLADEYFNDTPTLQDLCGDRIYDEAGQIAGTYQSPTHDIVYIQICEAMKRTSHKALVRALDNLITDHEKRIKGHDKKK